VAILTALALVVAVPSLVATARRTVALGGPSDFPQHVLPMIEYYHAYVDSHGTLPLWKPTQYLGHVMLGDPQQRLLYPPMALYALFAMPLSHHLYILFHLLVRTFGMYALLRRERCGVPASLLGGVMAGLSFKAAAYELVGWDNLYGCNAYLPLSLLFFREALGPKRSGAIVALAATLALGIYAGTPMIFAYLGLGLPAVGLLAMKRRTRPRLVRAALAILLGFGLAVAFAAPGLLPTLEMNKESARAAFGQTYGRTFEIADVVGALSLPDFSHVDFRWEDSNYLGLLALPLAGAGLLRRKGRIPFPVWLLVVSMILAAGTRTPFGKAIALLPVVGTLSYPTRLLWLASYAVVWLAAEGLDALFRVGDPGGRRRRRLAIGLAAGAIALALGLTFPGRLAKLAPIPGAAILLAIALALLSAALPFVPRRVRTNVLVGLALLTAAELLALTFFVLEPVRWETLVGRSRIQDELDREPLARVAVLTSQIFFDPVLPFYATPLTERADGYNPLHPRTAARLLHAIGGREDSWAPYTYLDRVARPDLAPLAVTHLLSHEPLPGCPVVDEEDLTVFSGMGEWIHGHVVLSRVPGALPRAFFRAHARSVPRERQLDELLRREPCDPGRTLLVDGPVPPSLDGEDVPGQDVRVSILRHDPEDVVLEVEAPEPGGYVVLLDGYSPGWKAAVDGSPAKIELAQSAFRAVYVPGGKHTVAMRLGWPRSFWVGCALCALGVVAAAAFALRSRSESAG
jgi:hypothetical protein